MVTDTRKVLINMEKYQKGKSVYTDAKGERTENY
jgi:hypothetical protein